MLYLTTVTCHLRHGQRNFTEIDTIVISVLSLLNSLKYTQIFSSFGSFTNLWSPKKSSQMAKLKPQCFSLPMTPRELKTVSVILLSKSLKTEKQICWERNTMISFLLFSKSGLLSLRLSRKSHLSSWIRMRGILLFLSLTQRIASSNIPNLYHMKMNRWSYRTTSIHQPCQSIAFQKRIHKIPLFR